MAARAQAFAKTAGAELGLPIAVAAAPEDVVRQSEIVVTTTPSTEPLIEADWLQPGQHITAMGSDAEHKNELAPGVVAGADRYVCDRQSQCAVLGELHHAIRAGAVPAEARFAELGQVIAGTGSRAAPPIGRSPSAISPAPVPRTPRSPPWPPGRARAQGAGTPFQT